jgi:hypothetical protein
MGKTNSITSHKPSRDTRQGRELAEARQAVKRLEREVARLRKRLSHYETPEETAIIETQGMAGNDFGSEEPDSNSSCKKVTDSVVCTCGASDWDDLQIPNGKTLRICRGCKIRRIVVP